MQSQMVMAEGAGGLLAGDRRAQIQSTDTAAAKGGRSRGRVLVADDDVVTRMLITSLLKRERFEVLEAASGAQAADIAARERPDLLLIDSQMGWRAARRSAASGAIGRWRRCRSWSSRRKVIPTSMGVCRSMRRGPPGQAAEGGRVAGAGARGPGAGECRA
jgi:CheY-like chemotaxis protein